jgi:hypothetical protein
MTKIVKSHLVYSNSLVLTTTNLKFFLISLEFSKDFKYLLYRKNILVTQFRLNLNSNRIDFFLDLYFRKKKLIKFKKLKLKKNSVENKLKTNIVFYLLKNFNSKFSINSLNLKIKILNRLILFNFFFKQLKKEIKFFKKSLFERRLSLYFDLLKIIVLYQTSQLSLDILMIVLSEIFQRLTKQKHGLFLKFIKVLFKNVFIELTKKNLKSNKQKIYNSIYCVIKGVKFIISGKLKGKLRAKSTSLLFGSVPISTESKTIPFAKIDVYTVYGKYGFKLWIFRHLNIKKDISLIHNHLLKLKKSSKLFSRFKNLNRKRFIKKK